MYSNPFVKTPEDLVTTPEARRTGFLEAALRRNVESLPYLNRAKSLSAKLKADTKTCKDVLSCKEIQAALLDAAGVYAKTRAQLSEEDMEKLLAEFVRNVLEPCGKKYIEEIIYRYLMALGEQLGGKMRNVIGVVARIKLTEAIVACLQLREIEFQIYLSKAGWIDGKEYKEAYGEDVKAIQWQVGQYTRMLVHNLSVPNVSKNVDIVVLNQSVDELDAKHLKPVLLDMKNYVVLGELKGGIDPAGADEHWKTARGALERLRTTFKKASICFVGGAIEKAMAKEIFSYLTLGDIDYAANLTNQDQLSSLCEWLIQQ